ncbi:alpha/beta hydrolase family protein [Roseospira visakhapatnamensis]|uniref:Dienelactone hydrolase n=1 Tax=Roseospira visakhapatnamensis TaxID=390880 RepID=A0A7W6W8R6_9PROT|nr:alpha/beta hydrolase family protein [Roseospira visakhapatnamensis]MBB4265098.1 dienelactone hydrolase [Roseospira visakhapatnamensis]
MAPDRLSVSMMHRVLSGPLSRVFMSRWFDRVRMSVVPREFRAARASAVAAAQPDVDAFLTELGLDGDRASRLRPRARRAMAVLARRHADLAETQRRWDDVFWGHATADMATRVALDRERRRRSQDARKPAWLFRFLGNEPSVAVCPFEVPPPRETLAAVSPWLDDPDGVYAAPAATPPTEISAEVLGPAGPESLIRFASPSPFMDDRVTARVYGPEGGGAGAPTFIYASGFGMMYDLIAYWPEEDYVARRLAARGIRVILPESPWHGRRAPPGCFSGQSYLARAPLSLVKLYAAQACETAHLVAWARARGSARVGVGGFSLGGLVTQQIASRCRLWPEAMRPDMAFIGAGSTHIDQVVTRGDISRLLGLTDAVTRAGWTDADLRALRPVLDPGPEPGVDPDAILAFLGTEDQSTPYGQAKRMLDDWRVPVANRMVFEAGHIALYARIIRDAAPIERIARMLTG